MPRSVLTALALLIVAAVTLWLWQSYSAPTPPAPEATNATQGADPSSGGVAADAVDPAQSGGIDRTEARPTVEAPQFVVEGLILAERSRPDLSSVRVIAYRGEPTDSSTVMMSGLNDRASAPSFVLQGKPIAETSVDNLGNFVLRAPAADLRLTIVHDVYLLPTPEIVHVPEATGTKHVVLAPILGACVRGRLFGTRASEVTGVRINIEPDPMSMMRDARLFLGALVRSRDSVTPDDGAFVFRGVIPGAPFALTARGSNAFAHMQQPALLAGETREVALSVRSAANLEVAVLDAAGQPIVDAHVMVRTVEAPSSMFPQLHARHSDTAKNGRCVVESLQPTKVHVEAMATGFIAADATIDLRAAPETNEVELTLGEGGVVTGTVYSPDGQPLADARVAHHPSVEIPLIGDMAAQLGPTYLGQITRLGARTDAEGSFRLTGLADPGEFLVVGAHADYGASYAKGVRMGDSGVEVTLIDLGAVAGRIVAAADQRPIEKFTLSVLKTMFLVLRAPVHTEVVSSSDGTFRLTAIAPGSYTLQIEADGYSTVKKDLSFEVGGADMGTIELPRGAIVSGVVRDENGSPVRGALVRKRGGPLSENPMMSMITGDSLSVRTDPEGRFELAPLPPGRLQLLASAEGFAGGRSERIRLEAGKHVENIDITLGHGGTVVGRLLTGPSESVSDFMLMAQEQRTQNSVMADLSEDGSFEIQNLDPGIYVVQAMPHGIFHDFGTNDYRPGQGLDLGGMFQKITDSVVSERCTVRAGETTEVELDAGDLIIGTRWTVRIEIGGKPMSTGIAEVIAIEGGRMRAAVFQGGAAILGNVEPGTYTLRVRSGLTMAPVGAPQSIEFPAGKDEHTTTVSLPSGELRGRVVNAETGEPLHAALVRLVHEDAAERDDAVGVALTDAEGNFAFPGLEDGSYGVVASDHLSDRESAASKRGIHVVAGAAVTPVELRAQAAATASVLVTSSSGAPVVGATCLCVDPSGRPLGALGIAVTDPSGRAWFGGMPRGDARVVARAPGLAPGATEVRRLDPNTSAEFSLILSSGTRTTVHAVDADGQPLNGATLTARCNDGPWLPAMLLVERLGNGVYEVGRLGPGTWEIRIHHPATGTMTQRRTIGSESAITVVVAPQ